MFMLAFCHKLNHPTNSPELLSTSLETLGLSVIGLYLVLNVIHVIPFTLYLYTSMS